MRHLRTKIEERKQHRCRTDDDIHVSLLKPQLDMNKTLAALTLLLALAITGCEDDLHFDWNTSAPSSDAGAAPSSSPAGPGDALGNAETSHAAPDVLPERFVDAPIGVVWHREDGHDAQSVTDCPTRGGCSLGILTLRHDGTYLYESRYIRWTRSGELLGAIGFQDRGAWLFTAGELTAISSTDHSLVTDVEWDSSRIWFGNMFGVTGGAANEVAGIVEDIEDQAPSALAFFDSW
ncbi:MAG: hypothetical protein ACJAYU_000451 [Bradymonadia bacterium]|jgi:hypothetical protein